MSAQLLFEEQLEWGRLHEAAFRKHIAQKGHHVVIVNSDSEDESPKVHLPDGKIVAAADLLCVSPDGTAFWVEVKAKSVPGYYYKAKSFRHGVCFRLWKHSYSKLAERADFYFAICEHQTLPHDAFLPPLPPRDAENWAKHYQQFLIDGPQWLSVSFQDAARHGEFSRGAGSNGKDMWNWPRNIMRRIEVQP